VNNLYFGFTAFVLASIGFSGSIVFYNSYLPEIVSKDKQDIVSAQGYAFGYVGSSILLLICVLFIENPSWLGVESTQVVRLTFFGAGIWWVGFSLIPFYYLPKRSIKRKSGGKVFLKGYLELKQVLIQLRSLRYLRIFLIAFFFYSMGIQTVLYTAGLFGAKVIQLEPVNLVIAVLLIQFLAVGGAYMFSFLSNRIGNLYGLLVAMVIWIGICSTALFVRTEMDFYLLAAVVGLVMGGVQALSRSTYSKILPKTQNNAAYFSFYDVAEKVAIVLGLLIFGLMEELTGSMRNSIFSLIIFFIIGIPILLLLNKKGQIDTSK
ncbi:MAG: MFS transporter, partial [Bacteroidetes bacterium]|nr:MFS transporter [Bacteroidota bacterium]